MEPDSPELRKGMQCSYTDGRSESEHRAERPGILKHVHSLVFSAYSPGADVAVYVQIKQQTLITNGVANR
jgi:hypothetical protein